MSNQDNVRKDREVFAALIVSVGCMLVGEESEKMLLELGDCPQADLGPGLLAAALTYLRQDPETLQAMAEAALTASFATLHSHFRATG